MAQGRPFVFSPEQASFLVALQKLKSFTAACIAINKPEDWANQFLTSKKFVKFRNLKLDEAKVKAGLTTEYLMLFAKWNLAGKKEWWAASCAKCAYADEWTEYQLEASRDDNMDIRASCPICFEPVSLVPRSEPFIMSRENMDMWKEVAARFWPKVERVHHEFSNETISFQCEEADVRQE